MNTPVDSAAEASSVRSDVIYRTLGLMCVIWGGFIILLMLIPNSPGGRFCFLFVGGVLAAAGVILLRLACRERKARCGEAAPAAQHVDTP
jgi:uncharacterized BrkB/YihY/UPF0761 family membrane protein